MLPQRVTGDPTLFKFLRDNFLVDLRNISAGRLSACPTLLLLAFMNLTLFL